MKRILILSAPIGNGHKMTAAALAEELRRSYNNIEVFEGDVFSFMPAWVGKCFMFVYLKVLAWCPWLYGLIYGMGGTKAGQKPNAAQDLWLREMLNSSLLYLGRAYLDRIKPDIVLATHATPLGIMSRYKREQPIWLGAVVPDYNIHHWWICDKVDAYFLADSRLSSRFPEKTRIEAVGLPLRPGFQDLNAAACREKLGFAEDTKVVLLMGGGEGLLPMEKLTAKLLEAKLLNTILVLITGNNKQLKTKLEQCFKAVPSSQLQIYGYREDVPQLLAAADVLISKAGAVTAAEALATGIDYIIYKPLPGQETGNAVFLHQHYGVKIAADEAELVRLVQEAPAADLGRKQKSSAGKSQKSAAQKICEYVLKDF